jgi:hypothetical protein
MSSKVLALTFEHVGSPIGDIMKSEYLFKPENGYYNIKTQPGAIKCIVAQIVYALAALNRHGIIHSDLHLNNITMKPDMGVIAKDKETNNRRFNEIYSVYIVGDQLYLIPTMVQYYIIDFSRSIIMPEYLPNRERDEIMELQAKTFHRMIAKTMTKWYNQNKDRISRVITQSPGDFYRVMTAYDVIISCDYMKQLFIGRTCLQIIDFLNKIIDEAKQHIRDGVDLIENHKPVVAFNEMVFPKMFRCYLKTQNEIEEYIDSLDGEVDEYGRYNAAVVTGIYKLDNPLKYSNEKYELMPDYLKVRNFSDEQAEKVFNEKVKNRKEVMLDNKKIMLDEKESYERLFK